MDGMLNIFLYQWNLMVIEKSGTRKNKYWVRQKFHRINERKKYPDAMRVLDIEEVNGETKVFNLVENKNSTFFNKKSLQEKEKMIKTECGDRKKRTHKKNQSTKNGKMNSIQYV